jgi:hypothetical protein
MSAGMDMSRRAGDLKFIILRNTTTVDFITSDNPAVVTNRYHFDKKMMGGFGVVNSGYLLALPITPKLAAFYFDIGVYTVSIARGTRFVDLNSAMDVDAINHLQCLSANKNLYFSSWESRDSIAFSATAAAKNRLQPKHEVETLVRDSTLPGEAYRKGSEDEEAASKEVVIRSSFTALRPSFWPSFLRYQRKPTTFSNGTAVGNVRKKEWLRGD